jgi:hypothetical protein
VRVLQADDVDSRGAGRNAGAAELKVYATRNKNVRPFRSLLFVALALFPASAAPFDWDRIPANEWVRIPTTGVAAPKVFHGGAAIAAERGEIYFFGSDTHAPTALEKGESNALYRLDLKTLAWSQDYEQDPKSSYRILSDGQCVTTTGRPWAMHTFAQVAWDSTVQRVVVVSYPAHAGFAPEKRYPFFKGDWYQHLAPSHWEYDPGTRKWSRLDTNAPPLFAHALTWDSDRRQLIGHDGSKTYHFNRGRNLWETYEAATSPGWHLKMVYDTFAKRLLLLGNNTSSSALLGYDSDAHRWTRAAVEGSCLPANGAALAYDTRNSVMLYLANDSRDQYNNPTGKSVTFLYDSRHKKWRRLDIQSPVLYGMNYLTQYDPVRRVFFHFEKAKDSAERITVWAFRYREP